jgi:hypothetical protein
LIFSNSFFLCCFIPVNTFRMINKKAIPRMVAEMGLLKKMEKSP